MRVTRNGESSPQTWDSIEESDWPTHAREEFPRVLAELREQGEEAPLVAVNYFEPRPYRNEHDRGSKDHGFCFTVGRQVFLAYFTPKPQPVTP